MGKVQIWLRPDQCASLVSALDHLILRHDKAIEEESKITWHPVSRWALGQSRKRVQELRDIVATRAGL